VLEKQGETACGRFVIKMPDLGDKMPDLGDKMPDLGDTYDKRGASKLVENQGLRRKTGRFEPCLRSIEKIRVTAALAAWRRGATPCPC
jgi:hypothetical protein